MTDKTHDRHGYPIGTFYVAHKRFIGPSFGPMGAWGDLLDGPQDIWEEVVDRIIEAWSDAPFAPDTDELRVWQIIPGKPAYDCTELVLMCVVEKMEERP